jgi:hypothetical protein
VPQLLVVLHTFINSAISDGVGRKYPCVFCSVFIAILHFVLIFVTDYSLFCIIYFLIGFCIGGNAVYYIWGAELSLIYSPSESPVDIHLLRDEELNDEYHQTVDDFKILTGTLFQIIFGVGGMILALVAYLLPFYKYLFLFISIMSLLYAIVLAVFISESPQWISHQNDLLLTNNIGLYLVFRQYFQDVKSLLAQKKLKLFTLMLYFFVNTILYYAAALNSGYLGSNVYISFLLMNILTLPGPFFVAFFGHRYKSLNIAKAGMFFVFLIFIMMTLFSFLETDLTRRHVEISALSFLGMLCIMITFTMAFIICEKIFPIDIKGIAMGLCMFSGKAGAILFPWINDGFAAKSVTILLCLSLFCNLTLYFID